MGFRCIPICLAFLSLFLPFDLSGEEVGRPNIILVLADDIGVSGISSYGSDSFETPHIDQLAADGARFVNAFSTPICGPSRVCLMTGRYPFRTGGLHNRSSEQVSPLVEVAFPRLLKEAGYATFATGKWPWLGHMDKLEAWGFDESLLWNDRNTTDRYWNPNLYENGVKRSYPGGYGPDVMQDAIFAFIDHVLAEDTESPFFAYYASALPHTPMIHTPDSRSADIPEAERYRDMVHYMDKQVGQMREQLEKRGLAESTLLIFTGDNGSISKAGEVIDGLPVLGGKGEMKDGGVRVPLVAYWPGKIAPGTLIESLVDFSDFFPTILEVAGLEKPSGIDTDGVSFAPLLEGREMDEREWVYYQIGDEFALRNLSWKLDQDGILYDVREGIHREVRIEEQSIADSEKARAALAAALRSLGVNP